VRLVKVSSDGAFLVPTTRTRYTHPVHFLISGIPASGKSTFSRWLEEKKGFLHLNVEEDGVLDRYGLAAVWLALFGAGTSAASFLQALDRFNRPVVIDWGFPPEHLGAVRKLSEGGVMLWWFAADWAVARRKFEQRRYPHVQDFDIQIREIEAALPEINALFRSHVEYVLPSTGIYTRPDKIWESMIDTLTGPRKMLGLPVPVHFAPVKKPPS
jgi:hypothetical protein